jgi:fumarate reductase flavoprotein subunit
MVVERRDMKKEKDFRETINEEQDGNENQEEIGSGWLSRRAFAASMAVAGATAMVIGITGCSPSGQEGSTGDGEAAPSNGAAVTRPANMTPGTYIGEAPGHRGTLKVSVTVAEDRIESIDFVEAIPRVNEVIPSLDVDFYATYAMAMLNEAPQILNTVVDRLGSRIVEYQSLNVDAISGATMTSFGYRQAVRAALAQSGGDVGAFDVEVPKKEDTQTLEGFDVIVVGGGASGATAAANATANGARVLLIEKSARIGGCGSMSSGFRAIGSKFQKTPGDAATVVNPEPSEDSEPGDGEVVDTGLGGDNRSFFPEVMKQGLWYPKAVMVRQFLDNGGKVVDFLLEKGGFLFGGNPTGVGYARDSIVDPNASESWYRVANTADTVLLETRLTGLLTDDSEAVIGIEAESWDGVKITAKGKAVVIATGGFMGNPELQEKYNHSNFSTSFSMRQDMGEGLQILWDAGAHEYHIGGMNIHITQPAGEIDGVDDYTAMIPYTLSLAPNILRVNGRGERFSSETSLEESMVGNGNYLAAQGRYFYSIVSRTQMDLLAREGLVGAGLTRPVRGVNFNFYTLPSDYKMEKIRDAMDAGIEAGFIFRGETLEELAGAAGFKPATFKKHVERYDQACANGYDDLYYKDPLLLFALGAGPYYAIRSECCPYSTMGGVEVDEEMHVLDADGDPIGGGNLFSAGCECIGVLYGGAAYSDLGGFPLGWATYSGFAAGASAAGKPLA